MSPAIAACSVVFVVLLLAGGDWSRAASMSLGPLAVVLLFPKKARDKETLDIPARRWLEQLFAAVLAGVFYTAGVVLVMALVWMFVLRNDAMSVQPFFVGLAHLVPHSVIKVRDLWHARRTVSGKGHG